jgi:hypothetical protein
LTALSTSWKFQEDPSNVGITDGWFAPGFNDSAWPTILSGESWESQGYAYSGYAWYRQSLTLPAAQAGQPIKIALPSMYGDDDFYFNGVRVAGLKGEYKFANMVARLYVIPGASVNTGTVPNEIAIRIWGGYLSGSGRNSGLAGACTWVTSPYYIFASPPAGTPETPIEIFDLSGAQQGMLWNLVVKMAPPTVTSPTMVYTISDFYSNVLSTGTVPIAPGTDGVNRGIVPITAALSTLLYLSGRFEIAYQVVASGSKGSGAITTIQADHLSFVTRDTVSLPPIAPESDVTPYGTLVLNDAIDCSLGPADTHGYMQGVFAQHLQDNNTPGAQTHVEAVEIPVPLIKVSTILGKTAREANYGFFAYKVGRNLVAGQSYLLRVEYAEDVPRMGEVTIQSGLNYLNPGWRAGFGAGDVYSPQPLSGDWEFFDVMVVAGQVTAGAGGARDAGVAAGIWVYFLNKVLPPYYWSIYSGGPAVTSISLYEIDPVANAPVITLPQVGLPQRIMTVDWEREPLQSPTDMVNYARLMGYSALSPIAGMKWQFENWADPIPGYDAANTDANGYWSRNFYVADSGVAAAPPITGKPSTHAAYLAATAAGGIDYIPRFEYGGSYDLPMSAWSIDPTGNIAQPDRYATWGANLLNPATFAELKTFLNNFIGQYAATNPQLKGALWRMRCDRMQISYGATDATLYSTETGTPLPTGFSAMTAQQIGVWCEITQAPAYQNWWHGKRAAFHQSVAALLQSYRADLTLLYYNWDEDKFSIGLHDRSSGTFDGYCEGGIVGGAPAAFSWDAAFRATFTAETYTNDLSLGSFRTAVVVTRWDDPYADYGIRPSLYSTAPGVQILMPLSSFCYALPDYISYFQTYAGHAMSNAVSYEDIGPLEINPEYAGHMLVPGGRAFSMSLELLSYFYGDTKTLTLTIYTYGRGFADMHRAFAQAFRALPAVPGTLVAGTDPDVAVRIYPGLSGSSYIGVAYKGFTAETLSISIPGTWAVGSLITDLVAGNQTPVILADGELLLSISAQPMELNAYRVDPQSESVGPMNVTSPQIAVNVGIRLEGLPGTWSPAAPTITWQWMRDGVNIPGATLEYYVTTSADITHVISLAVTATNSSGSTTVTIAPLAAVGTVGAP